MALGTITLVERAAAQGPLFVDRISIVGDDAYPAGGTPDFESLFQAADSVLSGREIVAVLADDLNGDNALEYDHANDKLFVRVRSTGAESAVSDQSGNTYRLTVLSK